ncbi:ABC transporter ATP-binding protein [Pseudanabaena biceps]|nr:ABC transporter ATP-binding protein [Pseudanabaena biceps]
MSDTVIRVENLGKRYRIGLKEKGAKSLKEQTKEVFTSPFKYLNTVLREPSPEEVFWALKDVSFEVKRGEVLGVIGRNGAGKSTLLKILSRITEPTKGFVEIRGRVGSLLEVGTGFHPDLTGRENTYLNGTIMGMKKREIDRRFDEIVDFAEVEKFIDTPVKHYSSGMYTRLAFAVAAHLTPEILIIDEVLAVGDAQFQKKCLGKMNEVSKEGRTVLFVSHNLASLANLCSKAVLMVKGTKVAEGECNEVINEYINFGREAGGEVVWKVQNNAPGNDKVRLHAVRVVSTDIVTTDIEIDKDIYIEIEFWNFEPDAQLCSSIHVLDKMGTCVLASANMHSANLDVDRWFGKPHPIGLYRTVCKLPGNFLNEGLYSINAFVLSDVTNIELRVDEVISFTVHDTGAMRKEYGGGWIGVVRPKLAWQTEYLTPLNENTNVLVEKL